MIIYISGPYTKGDVAINVRRAIDMAESILARGHIPYIPHLTHFWHMIHQHDVDFWYNYDLVWIPFCDAILRLPGESKGADREVEFAIQNHKEVFYKLSEVPIDIRP